MANTHRVAEETKQLILATGADLGQVHIMGFSLGAQVAGFIGHRLNGRVARVTGLDPAG